MILTTFFKGADPAAYPHAYLVTAARSLGYISYPFSYWYLYSVDMSLDAMVVEVKNTSDERHMYFLTPAENGSHIEDADVLHETDKRCFNTPVYEQEWLKEFHSFPFNSREGSYSLSITDILARLANGRDPINGTVTLRSAKEPNRIVTQVVSDGQPVCPSTTTVVQKTHFLLSWWWVCLTTFPRMWFQAGRLWFESKLHAWNRPVPLCKSLGRNLNSAERTMEVSFREYLRSLVEQCQAPIALTYIPSGTTHTGKDLMFSCPAKANQGDGIEGIVFKVLSPEFYTRFAFYAHDLEALFSELRESCTVWVSRPDLLPKLLFRKPTAALEIRGSMDYLYFRAIRYLR